MKYLQTSKRNLHNNKRGGMLVLVLLIFAVSLILISSAISITVASRNRYYVDAETSQERLTLTCAAEAVIDAIMTQEITDAQLEAAAAGAGTDWTITGASNSNIDRSATATDGTTIAPGLANTGASKTVCHVSSYAEGSNDIVLDFHTTINATGVNPTSENLRVHLQYNPPIPDPEICPNMTTTGEDGSSNSSPKLFMQDPRSYTVYHGNVEMAETSGSFIHNTAIFTGNMKANQGTKFYNDVVFYGPNAGFNTSSGGNGLEIVPVGDSQGSVYFLGCEYLGNQGTQKAFMDASNNASSYGHIIKAEAVYFYNASATFINDCYNNENNMIIADSGSTVSINRGYNGNTTVVVNGTGSYSGNDPSTTPGALVDTKAATYATVSTNAAEYMDEGALKKAASRQIPTAQEMQSNYGGAGLNGAAVTAVGNSTITSGSWKMSGPYKSGVLTVDLSEGDVYIRMSGNVNFDDYYIYAPNTTENHLFIIMEYGCNWHCDRNDDKCKDTKRTCGLVSCSDPERTDWTNVEFVQKYNSTGSPQAEQGANLRATPGQAPSAYVLGLGKNELWAGRACTIEGYICLGGRGEDASQIALYDKVNFYGRFESVLLCQGDPTQGNLAQGSDNLEMYWCPQPGTITDADKPLQTNYHASSYEYYYPSGAGA